MQKRIDRVKGMLENGNTAEEVAKVIIRAATSSKEEHNLRYIIGSDAESVMEKRKKMTDREFFNFMCKNILDTAYN